MSRILTQKQEDGKPSTDSQIRSDSLVRELQSQAKELKDIITSAAQDGTHIHIVEQKIWNHVLSMGHQALKGFFQLMGNGDMGETVALSDGRSLRRLEEVHRREYLSIFGLFELGRIVYGTREGQKIELVPLDQRLGLPENKFSYLLQDWDQSLAVEDSFAQVSDIVEKILGFSQSVDSLERMNRKMATTVVDYWDSLDPPEATQEGQIIVGSVDFKGVPMRHVANDDPIAKFQSHKGPTPGGKKMALLGSVYTVDRFDRDPQQIVGALFKDPKSRETSNNRPIPQHKRLRASLERDAKDTTTPSVQEIFGWIGLEIEQRNPQNDKPVVFLMDGQRSLWEATNNYIDVPFVGIIDLLHVTPRIWAAARLFYPDNDKQTVTSFLRKNIQRILEGRVDSVIRGFRRQSSLSQLEARKRGELEEICQYFKNNRDAMKYDEYLAAGYPIATGVIEGACRHLVKDRLERTGMSWCMPGAQAMLDLRSISLCDLWDEFTSFRIRKEQERLYPHANLTDNVEWTNAA